MNDDLDDLAAAANPNLARRVEPGPAAGGYYQPLIPQSPAWPAPYYGEAEQQPAPIDIPQQQPADALTQLAAGVSNTSVNVHVHSPAYHPAKQRSPFAWGFGLAAGVIVAIVACCFVMTMIGTCSNAMHEGQRPRPTYER